MKDDLYLLGPEEADDYGAFSEDQLYERTEDTVECELCHGIGSDENISECCGATRDVDTGLCLDCREHCGSSICPECNGMGIINKR